jgi:nitrogen regulatory protein PII
LNHFGQEIIFKTNFFSNNSMMKKVEAIVRMSRFDEIRKELADIGVQFFTMNEVRGIGLQKGETMVYRGSTYDADYISRLQINIYTTDDKVEAIIKAITKAGRTGEIGDGKIAVLSMDSITRVRTGEMGAAAL